MLLIFDNTPVGSSVLYLLDPLPNVVTSDRSFGVFIKQYVQYLMHLKFESH